MSSDSGSAHPQPSAGAQSRAVRPNLPPPLSLPALHFGAAIVWLAIGASILPSIVAKLAAGSVFDPHIIAFVHMIMLGAMVTAVFGTLTQFLPGGLGVGLASIRSSYLGFWLLQAGILVLIPGFWYWNGIAQGAGWVLIVAGLLAHCVNTLRVRFSTSAPQTAQFVLIAHASLALGIIIAAARIGETLGLWHLNRLYLLAAHALLGAVGFGTLMTVGVGSRMLPMFLAAQGNDRKLLSVQLWLFAIGLAAFVAGAVASSTIAMRAGALLILAGGCLTTTVLTRWVRRSKRALDASLRLISVAIGAFMLALIMGVAVFLFSPLSLHRWAAAFLMLLIGWLVTLILGVMSRILPNLTFVNLASDRPRIRSAGSANRLLSPLLLDTSAAATVAALLLLSTGIWIQNGTTAITGSLVWALAVSATVLNYGQLLRKASVRSDDHEG